MKLGLLLAASVLLFACQGEHQGPGTPNPEPLPAASVDQRSTRQAAAFPGSKTQILFGDLHVHSTFSPDAFVTSLPLMGGEGLHPPADACDYARYCAALDFWSINDHAEGISPQHWGETVQAIQECNAVAGDPADPDTVAFLGWEWSQVGATPETHYGHKNVIFRDTETSRVPKRPIAAPRPEFRVPLMPLAGRILLPIVFFEERQRYLDYFLYQEEVSATPECEAGVDTRELPADCHEVAADPRELFAKLDQWGFPSLVIPHGNTWGLMTPARSSWDLQTTDAGQHDSSRQKLLEIYSGHGNSEELRDWRAADLGDDGELMCPQPTPAFEPCCWRAGEIIRSRCEDGQSEVCEARVEKARSDYLAGGAAAHNSVPGATTEEWLDCGQCRDCFAPAFNYRPGMSAQYAIANDFGFGFIGSSDNHAARGGNGFKEHARPVLTEARSSDPRAERFTSVKVDPTPESITLDVRELPLQARRNTERGASYLLTGGLAAVHASARDRGSIWQAFDDRRVYGTSGDRILLWFDLLNAEGGEAPMGATATAAKAPRFRVRAAGAFFQKPGCPEAVEQILSTERIQKLCLGECYSPSDRRRRITRVEVVRIELEGDGPESARIRDPWKTLPCPDSEVGCTVEFEDPTFAVTGGRVAYYVRAIQEPSPAVNGGGLRCERDEAGNCIHVRPCWPDPRTDPNDDCLAEIEERAWSSPIFVRAAMREG